MTPASCAGRDRLPTVRQDFFLDPDYRLSEQERALMTSMLHQLVGDVIAEIQALLPEEWLPANEDEEGLIQRLATAGLLDIEEVMALLLRSADQERVSAAAQQRSIGHTQHSIQGFVSDASPEVAAAAMGVLIARGRRRNRHGGRIIELDDLFPADAKALVFAVAAGLRECLPVNISANTAEQKLHEAASTLLEAHDHLRSIDSITDRFARALADQRRIDTELVESVIRAGDVAMLCHLLGENAGLDHRLLFDELMSGEARRVMLAMRLAGMPRSAAAVLLATIGDLVGLAADGHALDAFDQWAEEQLNAARVWMGLDQGFRSALYELGTGNGHRTL